MGIPYQSGGECNPGRSASGDPYTALTKLYSLILQRNKQATKWLTIPDFDTYQA
jgi:hypothetical protein